MTESDPGSFHIWFKAYFHCEIIIAIITQALKKFCTQINFNTHSCTFSLATSKDIVFFFSFLGNDFRRSLKSLLPSLSESRMAEPSSTLFRELFDAVRSIKQMYIRKTSNSKT